MNTFLGIRARWIPTTGADTLRRFDVIRYRPVGPADGEPGDYATDTVDTYATRDAAFDALSAWPRYSVHEPAAAAEYVMTLIREGYQYTTRLHFSDTGRVVVKVWGLPDLDSVPAYAR